MVHAFIGISRNGSIGNIERFGGLECVRRDFPQGAKTRIQIWKY
jgi:hypothetical protein